MRRLFFCGCAIALFVGCSARSGGTGSQVVWQLDNLRNIGGYPVTVSGSPRVIDTRGGKAVEFDGIDDAIFLDVHPLAGMTSFTVEVIFRPDAGGAAEQRFFHMQELGSESRVMFETRLVGNDRWFLDTFIRSGTQGVTLYAEEHEHPVGSWHSAAIVVDDGRFEHLVNGKRELAGSIQYVPQVSGQTSLGARINKVHWFRGAIRTVRFTPYALAAEELMTPW